ncbi:MAG TPA: YfiR family protein, partial [Clostridia bacterium]|nr:YfiR family protein [Clostridia bacterium]
MLPALCALTLRGQVVSREYQLKAVFLYRFTQFVDWPPTAFSSQDSPIIIGVLGRDPFGGYLEAAVRNERVRNRLLAIQHHQRIQDAMNCHLLFISPSEQARQEKVLADLKARSILTVGETEGFARDGGMIQFITEQNRIRFRINLQ